MASQTFHLSLSTVAVSCGFDTWFAVRLVMDYTISLFTWSTWDTLRIPHDQASTWFVVRLVMDYTISLFTWSTWDTLRIPHDQASPSQTHRCPGASGSRQNDHVIIFDQSQGTLCVSPLNLDFHSSQTHANQYWHLSYPTYRCTWVVLWLLFFRSAPSTFPDTWSTFKGPFRGVPSR